MMDRLKEALSELKLGGVIAFPSEGVWGLGCDPNNESAVTKLLRLKQRPMDKGLILVGGTIRHMEPYIEVERYKAKLLTKWPGPHTWVVPTFSTPKWITGRNSSVAVRVSSHPVISLLCGKFGGAIVSSSANLQGETPAKSRKEVEEIFEGIKVVEGKLGILQGPTPIQEIETNNWIRKPNVL